MVKASSRQENAGVRNRRQGQLGQVMHRLAKNKLAILGLFVMIALIAVALLSPWITPYDYAATSKSDRYALPNALIPIITIIGNGMGMMLGGTVIIENVFAIPGVGRYMTDAISSRDYPVVMGGVLVLGLIFSLIMLLVDIVYAFVDPRIKAQYEGRRKKKTAKEAQHG